MPESVSNNVKLAWRGELKLLAFCHACGHGARLEAQHAVAVIEGLTTKKKLETRLRCTKCRSKDVSVDWAVRDPRR